MTDLSYQYPVVQLDQKGRPVPGYPLSREFGIYLNSAVVGPVQTSIQGIATVQLTLQAAAIPLTPIPTPALSSGVYRVNAYMRVTQAAGVSSSFALTLQWTEGGVAQSQTFPAVTGNTVATVDAHVWPIQIDAGPISYSATYSSTGGPSMQFLLTLSLEAL